MTIPADITIDVWVNAREFKNVTYNNIFVESLGTTAKYPTISLGLAINGVIPSNDTSPALGALRGYVTTDTAGFNEIVTIQPVITLNKWIHIEFTRSLKTGMHLYVNGVERDVTVTVGKGNSVGSIRGATGLYIGHDSVCTIDNTIIKNVATEPTSSPIWEQWWFWTPVTAAFAALVGTAYYVRKKWSSSKT